MAHSSFSSRARRASIASFALSLAACGGTAHGGTTPHLSGIDRLRFNQLALRLNEPLFWASDANQNGQPDPDEVRSLLFYPTAERWVENGAFTADYERVVAAIQREAEAAPPADERRALVVAELDHAAPTLVETDLRDLPPEHRAFAEHMLTVAALMDRLYAHQVGMDAMQARLSAGDTASASLFRRNWGPECMSSVTESNPACSAIEGAPSQPVDVYPTALQSDEAFCATLEARPDASTLLTPFTVVRAGEGGALTAVPYTTAYADLMTPIAAELRAAADAMTDPNETALVAYLRAAATSFETNDWVPADEAWSRMSVRNSRWYVRVAPDETYWEPCSQHAGFHLTFARIDQGSLVWQDRLAPLRTDMEGALAALVPGEYTAREVQFQLPDFIQIVVNAGDDRDAFGATIGQSLPNWGPVTDEGRGRTVAMSNLYTDPDSQARRRAQAMSLLDAASMEPYTDDATPGLLSTILHEASHNLGPSHEYRDASGHTDEEAFGGGLASTFEELKAQSGALFFIDWLRQRGVLTEQQEREVYVDSIVWAFGHISRGMVTPTGQRKPYSQLAAIQIGTLLDEGALTWNESAIAADGHSQGAFSIDFARLPAACQALMQRVMHIKATGDRAAAEALAAQYVDGPRVPHATIVERYRSFPQVSFVYAVHE
ncbi:MAG: hypothetical protein U0234_20240 [Sandaracinus sp.]